MTNLKNLPTATLTRRLAALSYDFLLILGMALLSMFLITITIATIKDADIVQLPPSVVLTLIFTICFFYYSHSWLRGGQTVGMKAWRIYLVSAEKGPLRLTQCMLRTGTGFFSLVLAGLGFWWALIDKQQRSWHDIASFTRVVFKPKGME